MYEEEKENLDTSEEAFGDIDASLDDVEKLDDDEIIEDEDEVSEFDDTDNF